MSDYEVNVSEEDDDEEVPVRSNAMGYNKLKFMNSSRNMSSALLNTIRQKLDDVLSVPEASTIIAENKAKHMCEYYKTLIPDDKKVFLRTLATDYSVDQNNILTIANNLASSQGRGDTVMLRIQERLRLSLIPRYQHLFTHISRLEGGVKFLVDLRADVITQTMAAGVDRDNPHLYSMNTCLRDLLSLWFSVGFLQLERITWESPCDMLQKISDYEAVHPIRNWTDLKRRVGPYRRCFVFTHNSMPRQPVVVLHTALTNEISSSIQSIVQHPRLGGVSQDLENSGSPMSEKSEEPHLITTAIFYSITSTQKGLGGVELGNYLIKSVVRELLQEFPHMHQFSSLSPIPGFKDWLISQINLHINAHNAGELPETMVLRDDEQQDLSNTLATSGIGLYETFKKAIINNTWVQDKDLSIALEKPLTRLCARYLYLEKRRGFALNPVANFHLRNGAVMWRINWLADTTPRGLGASCGLMVNYRYFLGQTEQTSQDYMEKQHIAASDQILDLVRLSENATIKQER